VAELRRFGGLVRTRLREEMQIEFTLMDGQLRILDAVRVPRSPARGGGIAIGWPRRASSTATRRCCGSRRARSTSFCTGRSTEDAERDA
jgi:hypothetical protein